MKTRILKKLDEIEKYLSELEEMFPSEQEFLSDTLRRRACEKTIELAIETVIDVCFMMVSAGKLGLAEDEESIFSILVKKKVIRPPLGLRLHGMKGFRNILIHRYGDVNDKLTYGYLAKNLGDFGEFKKCVVKYLQKMS